MGWSDRRGWQDGLQRNLSRQLADLQEEVSSLGRSVARYGGQVQHEAESLGDALWHGGEMVTQQLGREAKRIGRAVRQDPLPAAVAIVALVGVVAALSLAFARK